MAKERNEPRKCWDDDDSIDDNIVSHEEGEEEALSLSDLPICLLKEQSQPGDNEKEEDFLDRSEPEFEFGHGLGSWPGSISAKPPPEMCAADELFFQGRILPQRRRGYPIGSTAGFSSKKPPDETQLVSALGPVSTTDSMESSSISRVTSISSRSSSNGSQHSSCSTTSTSTSFRLSRDGCPSTSNWFLSCPSPKPQTGNKLAVPVQGNNKFRSRSLGNSTMWEFLRLGLVRTPDMELHNLKTRASNNNISNKTNNDSNDSNHGCADKEEKKKKNKRGTRFRFLGGCKCTVDAVATDSVLMRSDSCGIGRRKSSAGISGEEAELRRKLMELIESESSTTRKTMKEKEAREKHHAASASGHRTSAWVKKIPHVTGYYALDQCSASDLRFGI